MRGNDTVAGSLFRYVDLEHRVRAEHPLRVILDVANATLQTLSSAFDALCSPFGRQSIPPERQLRALLLQAFYSIRSERQLVERLDFDPLFRWFVGLGVDDPVWDRPPSPRTATACWPGTWRSSSWPPFWRSPRSARCCRASISRWTARCGTPGPAPRASGPRIAPARRPMAAAMVSRTSTVSSAATTPMPPPPIRTPGCTAWARARRQSWPSWAMRSWKTGTG